MEHMNAKGQSEAETQGLEVFGNQEQDVTSVKHNDDDDDDNNIDNTLSHVHVLPPSVSVASAPDRSLSQPGLIHFLRTICVHAKVSELALVISLIYVDRLKKVLTSMARGDPDTPFKIILSALLVVKKVNDICFENDRTMRVNCAWAGGGSSFFFGFSEHRSLFPFIPPLLGYSASLQSSLSTTRATFIPIRRTDESGR